MVLSPENQLNRFAYSLLVKRTPFFIFPADPAELLEAVLGWKSVEFVL